MNYRKTLDGFVREAVDARLVELGLLPPQARAPDPPPAFNPVREFLSTLPVGSAHRAQELWAAYQAWAAREARPALSLTAFGRAAVACTDLVQRKVGLTGRRYYRRLGLPVESPGDSPAPEVTPVTGACCSARFEDYECARTAGHRGPHMAPKGLPYWGDPPQQAVSLVSDTPGTAGGTSPAAEVDTPRPPAAPLERPPAQKPTASPQEPVRRFLETLDDGEYDLFELHVQWRVWALDEPEGQNCVTEAEWNRRVKAATDLGVVGRGGVWRRVRGAGSGQEAAE